MKTNNEPGGKLRSPYIRLGAILAGIAVLVVFLWMSLYKLPIFYDRSGGAADGAVSGAVDGTKVVATEPVTYIEILKSVNWPEVLILLFVGGMLIYLIKTTKGQDS